MALDYECLQYSIRTLMSRLLLLINNHIAYGHDPSLAFNVFDRYLNESFNMKLKFPEKEPNPIKPKKRNIPKINDEPLLCIFTSRNLNYLLKNMNKRN